MKKIWKTLKIIFGAYLFQTIIGFLAMILYIIVEKPGVDNIDEDVLFNYIMIGTILSTIPTIIYVLKKYPRKEKHVNIKRLLLMVPFGIGLSWFFNMLTINFQEENILLELSLWLLVLFTVVLGPIFEELVFRYVALKKGEEVYSNKKALIIVSLVFGLLHTSIVGIIYAFLIGLILGWIYQKEENILYPIVIHMAANLASLFVTEYNTILLIVSICLLLGTIISYRKLTN